MPGQPQVLFGRLLGEINKKLTSGEGYENVLDFVFDSLDLIIPYDRIGIALVEGVGDEAQLKLKWVRSKVPVKHLNLRYVAPVKGSSLQKILETKQPRIINDLIQYSANHPESKSTKLIIQDGIRSSLTCPLESENKQIGVVFFSSCKINTYQDEHIKILLEIADELSLIIQHGQLRENFDLNASQAQNLNMILHDLKSPLSVIQGFAEMSTDQPWFEKLDPDGKNVFGIFLRNTKYMFALLNELSELSELKQGANYLDEQDVLMKNFCNEITNFGRILADAKEIEFVAKISVQIPDVARFDRHKVLRVLDNLFSNAVKYSKRNSKVLFSVSCDKKQLTFAVSDQGLGIPPNEIGKLFQEFGKTSVRPTEGETSTGLGLAIAKKIVEQHDGLISVLSEVGKGSTFTFWIPVDGKSS
jgi:signal transduction histidine kinase